MNNTNKPEISRNRIAITLRWPIPEMGWPVGTVLEIACNWTPPPPAWVAWKRRGDPDIRLAPADLPPGHDWKIYGGLRPIQQGEML